MMRAALLRWARARKPDFIVGGHHNPYLLRWWLIPRNPIFNVYVHKFLRSDDDRAHHDHPWLFNASWLIEGEYVEHYMGAFDSLIKVHRRAGAFKFRWGRAPHRLELLGNEGDPPDVPFVKAVPCWTVFITGPRVRKWGFYCPKGWVHWKKFTAASDRGSIGKGCDQ